MKKKFHVLVDRGFRGVRAGEIGEFDASDPEVQKHEAVGFLLAADKKKTAPAPATGHGEDEEEG